MARNKRRVSTTGADEIRINLGCGVNAADGWENYDRSPMMMLRRFPALGAVGRKVGVLTSDHMQQWPANVQRRDLSKPLPFDDEVVSAAYSSHMLEHLYLDDARSLLRETRRVMKPGSLLRLALPDGELWASDLLASANGDEGPAGLAYHQMLRAHPDAKPKGRRLVTFVGGSNYHKWQPTRGLAKSLLTEAGFTDVEELTYRVGKLPDLDLVEFREDSMFFEAVRA